MGKRSTIVLSDDDDDDDDDDNDNAELSVLRSKSKAKSVPVPSRRRAKKVRFSDSSAPPCKVSDGFDEIKRFCEDLDEEFSGFQLSYGFGRSNKDLWVDKYKPHSLEDLSVHKKKVEEVKAWLEERMFSQKEEIRNNVLIISGPAGVGKSAAVNVIASQLEATVCEWNTPTPTLWQEHVHNSNSGIRYLSKLDEFENFVERATKYGFIPSSFDGGSKKSVILLVDDLPVANGKVAYGRLNKCLHRLVQSALIPTVVLITIYSKPDSESSQMNWEELQLSLQRAGACKVTFNPITINAVKKTLARICKEEHFNADTQQLDLIAKASGGDIRHAITSLQYFCVKPCPGLSLSLTKGTSKYLREGSNEISLLYDGSPLPFGRDETISLFHALGKFLHNKREIESSISMDPDAFPLKDKFARLNLKMDAPEKVLCKAYGQARSVADFLHENVLDFVNEEAIDNASVVCMYLSDADFLLGSLSGMATRNYEAENVLQSSAASVAVRGVLFGNSHPSPSRWHTIRRPSQWQVERSFGQNKSKLINDRFIAYDGQSLSNLSVVATEFKPALKWLGFRDSKGHEAAKDNILNNDSCSQTSFDHNENETTDDEIEDW